MHIDIIDIGLGNIQSIVNSLKRLHIAYSIVKAPAELSSATLLLPGVGCAGFCMRRLRETDFDHAIRDSYGQGRTIVGICLGFQMFAEGSEENGGVETLGLMSGSVKRIGATHNGWSKFDFDKSVFERHEIGRSKLSRKRLIQGRVYFNHEYGVIIRDSETTSLEIQNDSMSAYAAMAVKNRLVGMQFHPEKSQATGLSLLKVIL